MEANKQETKMTYIGFRDYRYVIRGIRGLASPSGSALPGAHMKKAAAEPPFVQSLVIN